MKTNMFRKSLTAATVATVLGFPAVTVAQDAQTDAAVQQANLERIQVTGSRIRSTDIETAQPVDTISREDLLSQGFTSVVDVLKNMSVSGAPPVSRSAPLTSGESAGGNYANLRNLGSNRTLVLVNGKRLGINTDGRQDLSAIPMSMVERIDVLKDGASTIYGSDAMAGVINIITRKNYEGLELTVYKGEYSEGDGDQTKVSLVGGVAGNRGSITFGAEFRDEAEVWAKDRWFSAVGNPGYDINSNRTLVGQYGRFQYNDTWYVASRPGGEDISSFDDFEEQTYENGSTNTNDAMHLYTPITARSFYMSSNYRITDDIIFNADLGYSERSSFRQIAGYPLQSGSTFGDVAGWYLDGDSYFNPVGEDVRFTRRGWEVPRTTQSDQDTLRFVAELEGTFDVGNRYFDWDIGGLYSKSNLLEINRGNFHVPNVVAATGPSFMNGSGQVQCGTVDNPIALNECVPWNPLAGFGAGTVANSLDDPDVVDFLFPTAHGRGETTTTMFYANISGLIMTLPAGDLSFAVGGEYRKERGLFAPDALAQSGTTTTLAAGPTQGEYDVNEYYAELYVPILADMPGAEQLSVSLASRYSDYSSFGDTTNSKVGVEWKPIEDLLVRATWSEGFRAPTISDLYGGGSQTFSDLIDPCDSVYGSQAGSERCLQDVPVGYRQLRQGFEPTEGPEEQTPVPFTSGSNPNLQPETSTNRTIGFVYSPAAIENLDIILDWWSIDIEDTMVTDSPSSILEDCYVSGDESRCAMFSRDPETFIVNDLSFGLRNAGSTETAGYDLTVNYRFDTEFGTFGTHWSSTYTDKYDTKSSNDPTALTKDEVGLGSTFKVRSNLGLKWAYNDFTVDWSMRYYSSMMEQCYFDDRCNRPEYSAEWTGGDVVKHHRNGSTTFNDVQISYNTPWDSVISIGANNVFDKEGPVMFSGPQSNYSYYGGFDIGRFVYARFTQRF